MSIQTASTKIRVMHWHVVYTWCWQSQISYWIYPNQIGCEHTPGSLHLLTTIKNNFSRSRISCSHQRLSKFQTKTINRVTDVEIGSLSKHFRDLSLERLELKIKYYYWKFLSLTWYLILDTWYLILDTWYLMYLRVIVVSKRFKFQNMEDGSLRKKRNLYKITTFELINNHCRIKIMR